MTYIGSLALYPPTMHPAIDNVGFSIRYLLFLGVVVILALEGVHQSRRPWLWTLVGVALSWLAFGWAVLSGSMLRIMGGYDLAFQADVFASFRIVSLALMLMFLVARSWFIIHARHPRQDENNAQQKSVERTAAPLLRSELDGSSTPVAGVPNLHPELLGDLSQPM
jgi:uncharacterized membrane protein